MGAQVEVLLDGFPATSSRGFAGASSVVLVRTPSITLLFDTGALNDREGLRAALAARGLGPADVDVVVVSHLHFDHAGNVELFPSARLIVHAQELDAARLPDAVGYSAALTHAVRQHARLEPMHTASLQIDSGLEVVHAPGHTLGSIALRVRTDSGWVTLAGDAVKNREELSAGSGSQPCQDSAAWPAAAARIVSGAARIVPGHDVPLDIDGTRLVPVAAGVAPWRWPEYVCSDEPVAIGVAIPTDREEHHDR